MSRHQKLLQHILMKKGDANVSFEGLCGLLQLLGFKQRIRGDHHIFSKEAVEEIINLQPNGAKAKIYQVKQVRDIFLRYDLNLEE